MGTWIIIFLFYTIVYSEISSFVIIRSIWERSKSIFLSSLSIRSSSLLHSWKSFFFLESFPFCLRATSLIKTSMTRTVMAVGTGLLEAAAPIHKISPKTKARKRRHHTEPKWAWRRNAADMTTRHFLNDNLEMATKPKRSHNRNSRADRNLLGASSVNITTVNRQTCEASSFVTPH